MKASLLGLTVACVALFAMASPSSPVHAFDDFHIASESYYHVDVDAGTIDARVEAQVRAAASGDLETVWLWLMPQARDISATQDGQPLSFEHHAAQGEEPALIEVTLANPVRGRLVANIEMSYTVEPHESEISIVRPGAVESLFVSQGAGSFVLIDLPETADNALDPGCVMAANQPSGAERWVCGEVTMAAVWTNDQSVQDRCARMDDRCRQRSHDLPLIAFAQSITDESLISRLTADVPLSESTVPLVLRYFSFDREWAEQQFDVAERALPLLEAVFGFPYPHDEVLLRQSNFLGFAGFAGIAFTEQGEMLITASGLHDEHTTVHELAHQWASPVYVEAPWLWEGLAEYATHRVAGTLRIEEHHIDWESMPYDEPLATWNSGSDVSDVFYWYGKAGAFWDAYEAEVGGPEVLTSILAGLGDPALEAPVDGRWFMDAGEEVSGIQLDELFIEWIWNPVFGARTLDERRAAHDLVDELRVEINAAGFTGLPTDITANLRSWTFGAIASQVEAARDVLAEYRSFVEFVEASGLETPAHIAETWATTSIAGTAGLIAEQRTIVEVINDAVGLLATATLDSPAHGLVAEAREAFNAGDATRARELASAASEAVFNASASARMLSIAEAEQANYSENFLKRIGLLRHNPDAKLEQARQAMSAGEHAEALRLARSAFDSWNGAQSRGLQRLAILAGFVSALGFGAWWLLLRLDRKDSEVETTVREGHRIEHDPNKRRRSWRDYENTP